MRMKALVVLEKGWRRALTLLPLLGVLAASCSTTDITDPDQIVFPATDVSFRTHVQPYLALSCNITGCHDEARSSNGGVDLTSWVGVRASNVTVAGDTNSTMVLVMYGKIVHSGQFRSTENQRAGIKQWIREGAKNN